MTFSDYGIIINHNGGKQQKVTCPDCTPHRKKKKTKDLAVNTETGIWFCHHCGWKGSLNIKKRIEEIRMDIPKKVYKKPKKIKVFDIGEDVVHWFMGRLISRATLLNCGVTEEESFMPQTGKKENCVVFNYFIDGELINKKYRDGRKNMKMAKDARLVFYAPLAKNKHEYGQDIYITEGEPDCLTMIELGYNNSLSAPNGAPPENADLKNVDFSYLESLSEISPGFKKVYLVMDNDAVGARFRDEVARRIGYERCYKAIYPDDCKDINDVLVKHGEKTAKEVIENCEPYPISGKYDVSQLYSDVYNLWCNGFKPGHSTGFISIDSIYTVREGEFTIITGIPSHGKSSLLDHLIVNIANSQNWSIGIFSPENYPLERHIAKLCEIKVGKPFDKNYRGFMSEEELTEAVQWCNKYFHFILPDEEENQTIDTILNLAKASIFKDGIKGLVIDPWNEIEHELNGESETVYISKTLSKIRKFCRVNNVHIWIVAHPTKLQKNKKGEYPVPTPYDRDWETS